MRTERAPATPGWRLPAAAAVAEAVAEAHRSEWARVLAATARVTRDLDLAEECTQDAYARALETWGSMGIPSCPGAWLTTAARNVARDVLRRESTFRRKLPLLVLDEAAADPDEVLDPAVVPDDRLRLVFTCCHPALSREAQVALTLRLVCGMSTAEVARAFLVREATMAARITRAKRKIAVARIPYQLPSPDDVAQRIGPVLEVVYLVFTAGHTAGAGTDLQRHDLMDRALHLARMLHQLMPDDFEVAGLLALVLLTDARRGTRLAADGQMLLLSQQERSSWNGRQIREGLEVLATSLRRRRPARYAVQAAIAAVHAEAPHWEATDWEEVVALYDVLGGLWPSPVVELNRAVAIGFRDGPSAGLSALQPLYDQPALASYAYLNAARADFLRQLQRWEDAAIAYQEALALTDNGPERAFLLGRLAEVQDRLR